MAPSELRQLVLDDTPVPEQAQCIVFYYNLESKMWLDGMMLLFNPDGSFDTNYEGIATPQVMFGSETAASEWITSVETGFGNYYQYHPLPIAQIIQLIQSNAEDAATATEASVANAEAAAASAAANTTIKGTIDGYNHEYGMYSTTDVVTPTTLIIAVSKNMVTQANTGTGTLYDTNGVVVYQYISGSWQIRQMFEPVNYSLVGLRSQSQGGGLMWGDVYNGSQMELQWCRGNFSECRF